MDVQIVKFKSLERSYKFAKTKRDLEHTTLTIRKNLTKFKYFHLISTKTFWPELGLTLDERGLYAYKIIEKIYFKRKIVKILLIF